MPTPPPLYWWGSRPIAAEEEAAEEAEEDAAEQAARKALLRWSKARSEFDTLPRSWRQMGAVLAARPPLNGRAGAGEAGGRSGGAAGGAAGGDWVDLEERGVDGGGAGAGVVGKTVNARFFTAAARIARGVEQCAKRRAERRKSSRREVRGARKENETFAPAPAMAMPEWYTKRRARVRWERLAGLADIARHVIECHG